MAEAKTSSPKKDKRKKELSSGRKAPVASAPASSAPPKYSKAARRFYNENFRELQRLNKALAAAGGVLPTHLLIVSNCTKIDQVHVDDVFVHV